MLYKATMFLGSAKAHILCFAYGHWSDCKNEVRRDAFRKNDNEVINIMFYTFEYYYDLAAVEFAFYNYFTIDAIVDDDEKMKKRKIGQM